MNTALLPNKVDPVQGRLVRDRAPAPALELVLDRVGGGAELWTETEQLLAQLRPE